MNLIFRNNITIFILCPVLFTFVFCTKQTDNLSGENDLNRLVSYMTGSFSSKGQADADTTNYYDVRLEMIPIWKHRTDGYWLYVEQAMATHKDHPYRQRVYHITREENGTFKSEIYSIPDALRFAGDWQKEEPLAMLTPDSLSAREGCAVILRKKGDTTFEGSTVEKQCSSELRGAVYATSEVQITQEQLISWDKGFDAEGNQVWGATAGGYIFKQEK